MKSGLHSIWITDGSSFDEASRSLSCWIDHLHGLNEREIFVVRDFLSSECRIELPNPNPSDRLFGFRAISSLTLHDANALRTRLQKKARNTTLADILRLYGHSGDGGTEWVNYLCRQCLHFSTGEGRVALLVTADECLHLDL